MRVPGTRKASNCQGIDRHRQWLKQFLAQHLTGMGVAMALVVVDNFDISRSFFDLFLFFLQARF